MTYADIAKLSDIAEWQEGLFSARQARELGVSRSQLQRMHDAGVIVWVNRGAFRFRAAPEPKHEYTIGMWLSLGGGTEDDDGLGKLVAAGETAAYIHGYGDIRPRFYREFITSRRQRTRRKDVRLRHETLPRDAWAFKHGVPTLTLEYTIADLIGGPTCPSVIENFIVEAYTQHVPIKRDKALELIDALPEERKVLTYNIRYLLENPPHAHAA